MKKSLKGLRQVTKLPDFDAVSLPAGLFDSIAISWAEAEAIQKKFASEKLNGKEAFMFLMHTADFSQQHGETCPIHDVAFQERVRSTLAIPLE